DGGQVAFAIELDQERTLLDPLPLHHAQLLDLGADVSADLDLGSGLDPAGGVDLLDDLLPADLGRLDFEPLVAATAHGHDHRHADHRQEHYTAPQQLSFHRRAFSTSGLPGHSAGLVAQVSEYDPC